MRSIIVFLALLSTLCFGLSPAGNAWAQSPAISLSATPDTLTLAPCSSGQTIVIAKIPVAKVLSISLSAFTETGVDITIKDPVRRRPPLQGDVSWTVVLKRSKTGLPTGKVYLRADYLMKGKDGQLSPGVIIVPLEIQEQIPDVIDKMVTVDLQTSLETLQDRQSRQVFIIVKNVSHVPVTVVSVTPFTIPGITPTVQDLGTGLRLEPQQSHPVPITLTAGDRVEPGSHMLIVQIDVSWEKDGQQITGSLVLNKNFKVGVFGESAILETTTIPSVMLLPGCLFVITIYYLTKLLWRKTLPDLDFKTPPFWVISTTFSLLVILFYKKVTGPALSWLFGSPMSSGDYLQSYGFNDILRLWLGAVLFGSIVWVGVSILYLFGKAALWLGMWIRRVRAAARLAEYVPAEGDLPWATLRKIANNQNWLDLPEADFSKGDPAQKERVFVLPSGLKEPGKVWVTPRIGLSWIKEDEALKDEFDQLLGKPEDINPLIRKLGEWLDPDNRVAKLDWSYVDGSVITGPQQVEENQIERVPPSGNQFLVVQ